ncbi:hypothetical protein CAEBREN_12199 [Caenorhabditis brenneri]|uniref:Uncharacterized protein n=1 Tax=Caenorhabditis brenneri TaxID=135651 RepID=G0P8G4_CAEBE|nr:hypothetical protein CAEBREN_12199 [Caenorhabditis brenneri]
MNPLPQFTVRFSLIKITIIYPICDTKRHPSYCGLKSSPSPISSKRTLSPVYSVLCPLSCTNRSSKLPSAVCISLERAKTASLLFPLYRLPYVALAVTFDCMNATQL